MVGTLYSDDVTVTVGALTLDNRNASGHVIVKVGHPWNNYPEADTGQFEVHDSNGQPAVVVNNWGAAVFKKGAILEGGIMAVGGSSGNITLTADRVATGYTYYRDEAGAADFGAIFPPAVAFEELVGVAGVAVPPGLRFPCLTIVNRSTSNPIFFYLGTGITAVWSPLTPFTSCAVSTLCKVDLTVVAATPGAITFLMAIETASVS